MLYANTRDNGTQRAPGGTGYLCHLLLHHTSLRIALQCSASNRASIPLSLQRSPNLSATASGSFGSRPIGDLTTRHLADTTTATTSCQTYGLPGCLQSGHSSCSLFCPPSSVDIWVSRLDPPAPTSHHFIGPEQQTLSQANWVRLGTIDARHAGLRRGIRIGHDTCAPATHTCS